MIGRTSEWGSIGAAGSRRPKGGAHWPRILLFWRQNHAARRQLWQCALLDRRFAKDIGLTPDEIAVACASAPGRPVSPPVRKL
jgi:hypothetical protein